MVTFIDDNITLTKGDSIKLRACTFTDDGEFTLEDNQTLVLSVKKQGCDEEPLFTLNLEDGCFSVLTEHTQNLDPAVYCYDVKLCVDGVPTLTVLPIHRFAVEESV